MTEWTSSQRRRLRIGIAVLALTPALVGIWATVTPRGFYDDFPGGGHSWVSAVGAYDEHLVRDVGALYLGSLVGLALNVVLPLGLLATTTRGGSERWRESADRSAPGRSPASPTG